MKEQAAASMDEVFLQLARKAKRVGE
jgi:hypothetical protein